MKITKVIYGQNNKSYLVTDSNNKIYCVPLNENNTDYQYVLKWVAEGNTIEAAD